MITQDFGQEFSGVIAQLNKALAGLNRDKGKTLLALNMDEVFFLEGEESDEALIFFTDSQLYIEHRQSSENMVVFNTREVLEIIKFCLDNGLELPQNEDEKE